MLPSQSSPCYHGMRSAATAKLSGMLMYMLLRVKTSAHCRPTMAGFCGIMP